jgi:glycine hydroxymethyltransferase
MHVIAAKAVAFKDALEPEFKAYQMQVIANARKMAETLASRGLRIVSGRTESHMFLVDLRAKNVTGKDAENALGSARITVNKNAIPNDPQKPFIASGIRIGSPAMTTRGFRGAEAEQLGNLIADVLDAPQDEKTIKRVVAEVADLLSARGDDQRSSGRCRKPDEQAKERRLPRAVRAGNEEKAVLTQLERDLP